MVVDTDIEEAVEGLDNNSVAVEEQHFAHSAGPSLEKGYDLHYK